MKTRGWGPWRYDFYSICSAHDANEDCPLCNAGQWQNRCVHRIDGRIYRHIPWFWLWWHNRPNSKSRRTLERFFPNLRKGKAVNATTTKPQLPTWATWRCDWCGEPMWDGSLSWIPHGTTERLHTHGHDRTACERMDRRTQVDLPTEYVLAHQALIEASEQIGRFVAESDEEQYEDPKTLQAVLQAVQSTLDRGHEGMRHYDVERAS